MEKAGQAGKIEKNTAKELAQALDKMNRSLDALRLVYPNKQAVVDLRVIRDFVSARAGTGIAHEFANELSARLESWANDHDRDTN